MHTRWHGAVGDGELPPKLLPLFYKNKAERWKAGAQLLPLDPGAEDREPSTATRFVSLINKRYFNVFT